jgi:hypothetical protein
MRIRLLATALAALAAASPAAAADYFLKCQGAMRAVDKPGTPAQPMTLYFHVNDEHQSVSFMIPDFPGFRSGCRTDAVKTVISWNETVAFHCSSPTGAKHDIALHVPDHIRMETNAPPDFDNAFEGACVTTADPRPPKA